MNIRLFATAVLISLLAACGSAPYRPAQDRPAAQTALPPVEPMSATVRKLQDEAANLRPLMQSELARSFMSATRNLPPRETRIIYQDPATRQYFSRADAERLPATKFKSLLPVEIDEYRYYFTKYGSPLAYARPLELAAMNGMESVDGRRILDFGYGTVAHLRLLAMLGARTVGVDVDTYLSALYAEPADVGTVRQRGRTGTIELVHGRYPADKAIAEQVGTGYDLILSKNTLKRGYIKPARAAEERHLIRLGVSDEVFLKTLFDALKPGGLVVIYNLAPAQAPATKPYIPWADARSPYTRKQFETAGFKVLAHDANDDAFARTMGRRLGWDRNAKGELQADFDKNLFALYTIVAKPG